MSDQPLLDVQRIDNEIDQQRHAREHVPERQEQSKLNTERGSLLVERDKVQNLLDEADKKRRHLEGETSMLDARRDEAGAQLATLTSPKQAQAMQVEIGSLEEKIGQLEDEELVLLEEMEPLESRIAEIGIQATVLDGQIEALDAEALVAEQRIEDALTALAAERSAVAAAIDEKWLVEYERIRPGLGARAVVGFDGKNCSGCPFAMPAMEADRFRHLPEGTIDVCGECSRLVCR